MVFDTSVPTIEDEAAAELRSLAARVKAAYGLSLPENFDVLAEGGSTLLFVALLARLQQNEVDEPGPMPDETAPGVAAFSESDTAVRTLLLQCRKLKADNRKRKAVQFAAVQPDPNMVDSLAAVGVCDRHKDDALGIPPKDSWAGSSMRSVAGCIAGFREPIQRELYKPYRPVGTPEEIAAEAEQISNELSRHRWSRPGGVR